MITVTGGVYRERCIEPYWDDIFGSAGRAAVAIADYSDQVILHTYRAKGLSDGFENLESAFGLVMRGPSVADAVEFDYMHSLGNPRITPRPDAITENPPIEIEGDVVLRFGMLEGSACVKGKRVVYDPQSAFDPRPYHENGSTAETLAVILNRLEGRHLSGLSDPAEIVSHIQDSWNADVVVLKMGGHGAMVHVRGENPVHVRSFRSENVWKIGSGDVFSGAFAHFWGEKQLPAAEAAELASRATSYYCGTRSLPLPPVDRLKAEVTDAVAPRGGKIYLAAPFFNLGERWMVEEIRAQLLHMEVEVFSPLHDVGVGPGDVVAQQDLAGLDECSVVLAILNGGDAGTIFEIGYAVAKRIPVIALAQNVKPEDLKMPAGSGCRIYEDLVTAIYQTVWAEP
ncbi:PfkB family carbohydrate kinase [Paracoccus aminovorans]|uniref:PfkB family carbohydrate kinase n=1 Tax=Paracoccus aminovorans TaxID=34004 RepID=UPI002B25CD51|nr:PfkB family carbohydrate kinase [Paracoccus aminovorans]